LSSLTYQREASIAARACLRKLLHCDVDHTLVAAMSVRNFPWVSQKRGAIHHTEGTMNRNKMLIVIAAVALGIAGAVSSAQAGGKDDDGAGVGGIKIGPLRQRFGAPPAEYAFGYAPLTTKHVRGKRERRD
jgi:hypothetical protein